VLGMHDVSYDNEGIITATTIGRSILREIQARSFDERTVNSFVSAPDSLTLSAFLGPEVGEVYPAFDDVDDFNGHVRTVGTDRLGNLYASVTVNYTTRALAGSVSSARTFLKAVNVNLSGTSPSGDTNPIFKRDIVVNSIVAY
ncbi:MAG: hypothetical protein HY708_03440, partial [Ignavibacteriae bacterium]|nr:hypothetical protein [Ignavibacteriota bacterium]